MSAPGNRLARSAIRRTWGKEIKPLLLMGCSDDKSTMSFITRPMCSTTSSSKILSSRSWIWHWRLTLHWRHFPTSKYFLKIDDDVFLNVGSLHKYLRNENAPKDAIIGRKGLSTLPHRNRQSKWYLPRWLWQPDSFPLYIDRPAWFPVSTERFGISLTSASMET